MLLLMLLNAYKDDKYNHCRLVAATVRIRTHKLTYAISY